MQKNDIIGIGSPLIDLIAEVDDSLLELMGMKKGRCNFVDEDKSKGILKKLGEFDFKIAPGCSSANTTAGVAVIGGKAVYLGKIGKDEHGDVYEQETLGVGVNSKLLRHDSAMTGSCITFITPDAERSFAVHYGAGVHLKKEDVDEEEIKASKILHVAGFQVLDPVLKDVIRHAMKIAKENNVKVSIDLSDSGLIKGNLEVLRGLVKEYADIVFVNETEAEAFTGKKEEEALHEIYKICELAVVKLGEEGSLIKANGKVYKIPAYKVDVVNTNGAGDMYAAGILYGIANGLDIEKAGKMASFAASKVVSQVGARLRQGALDNFEKEV